MKNWCTIKADISSIAIDEEAFWTHANGRKKRENEAAMLVELEKYWRSVPQVNAKAQALASANNTEEWSAAFICYVFREAGVEISDGFIFRRRHLSYIVGALRNRENSDTTKPFWLYDSIEILGEAPPERGDLICYNRTHNGVYSNHSYNSLRTRYWGNSDVPTGFSHCNIVVSIRDVNGTQVIETIGGNINGSVRYVYLTINNRQIQKVDFDGSNPRNENDIFGIVKNFECA